MAKRKRLAPAQLTYLHDGAAAPETRSMFPLGVAQSSSPPIAQVAGESAASAALEALTDEMVRARSEGRFIQPLPLDAIEETHLVRDRMMANEDEMQVLIASLRARGQQTPIEVVALRDGRFGLISGWRRLSALRRLHHETQEPRFATVNAILRVPETAADAYLAMVEENEIRIGLGYYERARIVAKAVEQGVYADEAVALRGLFSSASRAKRSKIGSFLTIYHALDGDLKFAAAIPERLGLSLSKALKDDSTCAARLRDRLQAASAETVEQELTLLSDLGRQTKEKKTLKADIESNRSSLEKIGGIELQADILGHRLILSGAGVDAAFCKRLRDWLREQHRKCFARET